MATLQRPRTDITNANWETSDTVSSVALPMTVHIKVIHEIGSDLARGPYRREHIIYPSDTPTLVSVDSQVVTDAARRVNSPQYLASVRRRKSTKIKRHVRYLGKESSPRRLRGIRHKVVEEIREL